MKQRFFYCPKCGANLEYRSSMERERLTCAVCAYIFYENPVVGVAVIVLNREGHILLGKRNGSYAGLWCIPPGNTYCGDLVFGRGCGRRIASTG